MNELRQLSDGVRFYSLPAGRKIAVDVPHLAFATVIVGWCIWFCRDAWRSSADVENLIMIVPVSAMAIACYVLATVGCFRRIDTVMKEKAREPLTRASGLKIVGSMVLLGTFVVTGPLIGFDIACFVYLLAMMAFLGERRILVLLLVPLFFCVTAIYCFSTLLSTPLPLFFAHNS